MSDFLTGGGKAVQLGWDAGKGKWAAAHSLRFPWG